MSTTFNVAKVSPASSRQGTASLKSVMAKQLKGFMACSTPDAAVLEPHRNPHALIRAAHIAFGEHRPLVLSPDAIWVTIAQGLARHIGLNAEQYRKCFVQHEGKKRLEVWTLSFPGTEALPWDDVPGLFTERVKEEIGAETHDLIASDFTTTGPVERTVSQVVLLDAMQSYFEYYGGTMCGIPTITLEGTTEDWEKVHANVQGIKAYGGLDWWLNPVLKITDQFVNASRGSVDKYFWNDLFKINGGSGGPYINGWILHFIPYLYGNEEKVDQPNPLLSGKDLSRSWGGGGRTYTDIPNSLSKVPFIWNYNGPERNHEFVAGLFGIQETENLGVKPVLGWAVTDQGARKQ